MEGAQYGILAAYLAASQLKFSVGLITVKKGVINVEEEDVEVKKEAMSQEGSFQHRGVGGGNCEGA